MRCGFAPRRVLPEAPATCSSGRPVRNRSSLGADLPHQVLFQDRLGGWLAGLCLQQRAFVLHVVKRRHLHVVPPLRPQLELGEACQKPPLFLCLSRACLGKMNDRFSNIIIYKCIAQNGACFAPIASSCCSCSWFTVRITPWYHSIAAACAWPTCVTRSRKDRAFTHSGHAFAAKLRE